MIAYDFTNKAKRQLNKLPRDIQQRIVKKIIHYCSQSEPLRFAKHLVCASGSFYRFQIGDYRAIFKWEGESLLFTKIEHRGRAYQRRFWTLFLG